MDAVVKMHRDRSCYGDRAPLSYEPVAPRSPAALDVSGSCTGI